MRTCRFISITEPEVCKCVSSAQRCLCVCVFVCVYVWCVWCVYTYLILLCMCVGLHHNVSNANGRAIGVLVVDSECCPRQCLKHLSKDALLTTHAYMYVWSMMHKQQKKWLLTELSAAHDRRTMSFAHHLEQSKLCPNAWHKFEVLLLRN